MRGGFGEKATILKRYADAKVVFVEMLIIQLQSEIVMEVSGTGVILNLYFSKWVGYNRNRLF